MGIFCQSGDRVLSAVLYKMLGPSDTCLYSLSFFTLKGVGGFSCVTLSTLTSMVTAFQNSFMALRLTFSSIWDLLIVFFSSLGCLYGGNTNLPVYTLYFMPLGTVFCVVSCHSNSLWVLLELQ